MILTYDEGLNKASNKEWFLSFFKRENIASDEQVNIINKLVLEVGVNHLNEYLEDNEDIILQKEYVKDLIDYLNEVKDNNG